MSDSDELEKRPPEKNIEDRDKFFTRTREDDVSIISRIDGLATALFGEYFKKHSESFSTVDDRVQKAKLGIDIDGYLSRAALYSVVAGFVGMALGVAFIGILWASGLLSQFDTGLRYPPAIAKVLWTLRPIIGVVLTAGLGFTITASISFILALYYPSYIAGIRDTQIDQSMPYAVTFMYALSQGGMPFIEVLYRMGAADDTYGAVAEEFQGVTRDLDLFSTPLTEAFRRAGERSPSDRFSEFMDDLQGIIDSGAPVDEFLKDKSDEYLEEAERDQESFIQTLEMLGEIYVTAFVAGPLLLIVVVVVISLMGGGGVVQLYGIVYLLLPIMNFGFFILLSTITPDEGYLSDTLPKRKQRDIPLEELERRIEEFGGDERLEKIAEVEKRREQRELIRKPIKIMLRDPRYTAVASVPIMILYYIFILGTGTALPYYSMMVDSPIVQTGYLFVIPFMIVSIPYMLFFEIMSRRKSKVTRRFPDALKRLSNANEMGMTLTEALETASQNTQGVMGEEFERIANQITWEHDVQGALIDFANRVRVQTITRTVKMLTEAMDSSGDVTDVLDIAARDVMTQHRLKKKRAQQMSMYTVVVLVSFVVYLLVIMILDSSFLDRISGKEFSGPSGGSGGGGGGGAPGGAPGGMGGGGGMSVDLSELPVKKFRMVFFHSTIVQALGNGLLAGKLGSNDTRKGLKYSIILMAISTLVFLLFGA